ncbi:universal stress protein [Aquimarina algiphila]|nr:universal stress protein [Aquimarina algiphila]
MKKILVPTDFSNNAYSALCYATKLFKNEACHFYILNTFSVETPVLTSRLNTSKGEKLYKELSNESREKLTETFHAITRDTEDLNHTFEMISVSKKLSETINKTVKSKSIDLVVMGTKGASGAKEVLMGSNTVRAIQKIRGCSILAIPDEFDFKIPQEIAFATDLSRSKSKEELKPLIDIASLFDSKIRVVHIHEKEQLDEIQERNFKQLKEHLKEVKYNMHWVSKFDQKSRVINEFIDEMKIDMLSMLHYKHGFIESITREAVIKKIGFRLTIPFLVMPASS